MDAGGRFSVKSRSRGGTFTIGRHGLLSTPVAATTADTYKYGWLANVCPNGVVMLINTPHKYLTYRSNVCQALPYAILVVKFGHGRSPKLCVAGAACAQG
jgi:hypothetical protein